MSPDDCTWDHLDAVIEAVRHHKDKLGAVILYERTVSEGKSDRAIGRFAWHDLATPEEVGGWLREEAAGNVEEGGKARFVVRGVEPGHAGVLFTRMITCTSLDLPDEPAPDPFHAADPTDPVTTDTALSIPMLTASANFSNRMLAQAERQFAEASRRHTKVVQDKDATILTLQRQIGDQQTLIHQMRADAEKQREQHIKERERMVTAREAEIATRVTASGAPPTGGVSSESLKFGLDQVFSMVKQLASAHFGIPLAGAGSLDALVKAHPKLASLLPRLPTLLQHPEAGPMIEHFLSLTETP